MLYKLAFISFYVLIMILLRDCDKITEFFMSVITIEHLKLYLFFFSVLGSGYKSLLEP